MDLPYGLNPFDTDPGAWGASLLNNAEFLLGCLDTVEARSIAEVGAYAGDLTRMLLLWAEEHRAKVLAVDPSPQPELEQLERDRPELTLVRQTSLEALPHLKWPEVIILDGDHNYWTLTEELRLISERVQGGEALPLLLFHDVSWPHARRDDYFDPQQIPAEHRQEIAPESGLYPGIEGTRDGGMPYHYPAAREGGPRNGVLTAVEDFVGANEQLRLAVIPSFFGVGVVWGRDQPYADGLEQLLGVFDRNPLLERLERNRVLHLASSQVQLKLAMDAQEQLQEVRVLMQRMLDSRAFWAAEIFLRIRQKGAPVFSRAEIRRVMKTR
jgi:hypothetical protein